MFPLKNKITNIDHFKYSYNLLSKIIDLDLKKDPNANMFLNYNPSSINRTMEEFELFDCHFELDNVCIDELINHDKNYGQFLLANGVTFLFRKKSSNKKGDVFY